MIDDEIVAKHISLMMWEINVRLDASVVQVEIDCRKEEVERYRNAVGSISAEISQVLNALYEQHPSLKPPTGN